MCLDNDFIISKGFSKYHKLLLYFRTHVNIGEHDLAIKDYSELIRLNPDGAGAYFNRGIAKSDLERHEEALVDFDEAIRLNPIRHISITIGAL